MADQDKPLTKEEVARVISALNRASAHLPYGHFEEPSGGFDFRDANIPQIDFGSTPQELAALDSMYRAYAGCETKYPRSLDEVAREILGAETTFDLSRYNLHTSVTGARPAIIQTLSHLVKSDRPLVAYASPNWMFDEIVARVPHAIGKPFFAFSGDSFVEGFERLPNKNKTAALIIVDPANPLGYRLSKQHVERIEEIAGHYGIVPVFDDVFRGMQDEGQRHSSSEFSSNSVVVETTSKRLGIRGVGATWTLIPTGLDIPREGPFKSECEGCDRLAAMVVENLYRTGYGEEISNFVAANARAFTSGVASKLGPDYAGGRFVHAFDGMPIMTYHFPEALRFTKLEEGAEYGAVLQELTGVTPGFTWACAGSQSENRRKISKEEINLALSFVRICPTKETSQRSYLAGKLFGTIIAKTIESGVTKTLSD